MARQKWVLLKETAKTGCFELLVDTSAWVELFDGTVKGEKIKEIIKTSVCFTSAICIAELSFLTAKKGLERTKYLNAVNAFSTIIDLDRSILEMGGVLKAEKILTVKNFGLVDAIILATAKQYNLKILTGDKHFAGENAVII